MSEINIHLLTTPANRARRTGRTGSTGHSPVRPRGIVSANYILKALGWTILEPIYRKPALTCCGHSTIVRVTPADFPSPEFYAGFNFIQEELSPRAGGLLTTFDFVFNDRGQLIAVFPVTTKDQIDLQYLDLSPFYFEIPALSDPDAAELWQLFTAQRLASDQADISNYLTRTYDRHKPSNLVYNRQPHIFASINNDGKWLVTESDPYVFYTTYCQSEFQYYRHALFIPVFPSVYSPGIPDHSKADRKYYNALYSEIDLRPGQSVLVVGPGSGTDAWASSLRAGTTVYAVGINPLEIANLKATASIARFKVKAIIGDNIISPTGQPVFNGHKFDWIFWNMPCSASPHLCPHPRRRMADHWDFDFAATKLQQFSAGLPACLKTGGKALIWNSDTREVSNILSSGNKTVTPLHPGVFLVTL